MKFRLLEKTRTKTLAKFHVLDQGENVVGSVNVKVEDAADLLKHWVGGSSPQSKQNLSAQRQEPGFRLKLPAVRMSPAGILRGC
jgi:hypothetical protein